MATPSMARVIDLEEYRRRRDERRAAPEMSAWMPPVVWCWVWVPFWPVR